MDSRTNNTYRMLTTVASTIEANKALKAVTDRKRPVECHG